MHEPPGGYPGRVELPRYRPKGMLGLTVGTALLSVLAFVIPASARTNLSPWAALLISAGIVGGAVVLVHLPFLVGWGRAQWRRASSYDHLLRQLREADAQIVLVTRPRPLPVLGVDQDIAKGRIEVVLGLGPSNGVAEGDWLVILDTVTMRVVGRARVSRFRAGRCFAEMVDIDAVLAGFLRQQPTPPLPRTIQVVSQRDVESLTDKLQELQAEAEPWQ